MFRSFIIVTVLFYLSGSAPAQSVELSGIVTKAGSLTGIAGVTIRLAGVPAVSATTSDDGTFMLSGASAIQLPANDASPLPFTLNGNGITFYRDRNNGYGSVAVFSIDGKMLGSIRISDLHTEKYLLLPKGNSGAMVVRISCNNKVYTYRTVFLTDGIMVRSVNQFAAAGAGSLQAKKMSAEVVDTLIAQKNGYLVKKVLLDSYHTFDITVLLDSAFGNPDGHYPIPPEAEPGDITNPDYVIGTGTPESCTPEAFIDAVAQGGVIVFDCGNQPTTITLSAPAKVVNDANTDVVIDGGGLVTLSGGGTTRILYMNTCDSVQHWTTSHCQNQDHPRLTVQNLTFIEGNSKNETEYDGGGAIWVRGGIFKIVNCRFFNNVCADSGPDVGGAAVRVFSQFENRPVYVVNTTFGGAEGLGNVGANGGGISSIGVSWTIINCLFSHNRAIGNGGNPAQSGTPGGGSGGAIYNDGNTMTLSVFGTLIEKNEVNAYGSAIFFVTNDHSGDIRIEDSTIRDNTGGSWYVLPGISMHDDTKRSVINSVLE